MRKYNKGEPITSLTELLEQTWVIWRHKTIHIEVIKSWQIRFVVLEINNGRIFKAEKNEKTY